MSKQVVHIRVMFGLPVAMKGSDDTK
jgi:hypothetical protein